MTCICIARNLDYIELNMEVTRDTYRGMTTTTNKVEAVFCCVVLPLAVVVDLFKNGGYILCNCVIAVSHGIDRLIDLIFELWRDCCGDCCGDIDLLPNLLDALASPQMNLRRQINPIACGAFGAHDLEALKAALQVSPGRIDAQLEHLQYQIWFDRGQQTINIQERQDLGRTLSMKIIEGGLIESITLNGVNQTTFPQDFEACMWPCFMRSLEVSSSYNAENIRVIRQGLVEVPDFHLNKLAETLNQPARPAVNVRFLTSQLTEERGIDAGGLRRDYFDDLFKGLTLNKGELRFVARDGLDVKMPETIAPYHEGANAPLNTREEQSLYEKMGQAMMYVYGSNGALLTGRRFEDALFAAAFSLTPAEINSEFTRLSNDTLLKMCRAIFRAREVAQNIVDSLTLEDALEYCGRSLAPIHAIAKGIQAAKNRWGSQDVAISGAKNFSDRIQGSIDRETIATALQLPANPTPHLQSQVGWLRMWLRDPNTPLDHLRAFLKFATGSSSLPNGKTINVQKQVRQDAPPYYVPTLVGHSCFSQIDIAPQRCSYGQHNNHTQEKFIEALALCLTDPGSYSMA